MADQSDSGQPNRNSTDLIDEPELVTVEGSEISAFIDLSAVGNDKLFRPFFINQSNEDIFNLTLEDAIRLQKFLKKAIPYVQEYMARIEQ